MATVESRKAPEVPPEMKAEMETARVKELEETLAERDAHIESLRGEVAALRHSLTVKSVLCERYLDELKRYTALIDRLFVHVPPPIAAAPLPAPEPTPWATRWNLTREQEHYLAEVHAGHITQGENLGSNRKVNAIKELRRLVGPENIGLCEAKQAIERRFGE